MKLEKVNDHQIRCTLTKADLQDRELKLSELAYGTEKAKSLFRDMMQKAAYELGFEAEDIPLMIEAIPLSSECIVLIITKVEDPEELDTRFSNFAPSVREDDNSELDDMIKSIGEEADNVLDLFRRIKGEQQAVAETSSSSSPADASEACLDLKKAFSFKDVDSVIRLSHILNNFFFGKSSLYRDERNNRVVLIVSIGTHTPEDFNRVCNMISEYGRMEKFSPGLEANFIEHDCIILKDNALTELSQI